MTTAANAPKDAFVSTNFGRYDQGAFTVMRRNGGEQSTAWIDCRPAKPPQPASLVLSCMAIAVICALVLGPGFGSLNQSWPTPLGVIIGLALGFGPMFLFSDPRAHARPIRVEVSPSGLGVGAPPQKGKPDNVASRIALADLVRFEARNGASGNVVYRQDAFQPPDVASTALYGGAVGYMAGGGAGAGFGYGVGAAAGAVAGGVGAVSNALGNQMRRGRAVHKANLAATGCVVVAVVRRQPDVVLAGGFAPDVAGQLVDKLVECVEDAVAVGSAEPGAVQFAATATTVVPTPAVVGRSNYCRKCGFQLVDKDAFCGGCGTKLG